jgi:hypothetical protein
VQHLAATPYLAQLHLLAVAEVETTMVATEQQEVLAVAVLVDSQALSVLVGLVIRHPQRLLKVILVVMDRLELVVILRAVAVAVLLLLVKHQPLTMVVMVEMERHQLLAERL